MHHGTMSPEQLQILTAVLDEYCEASGIPNDSAAREELACTLMTLFTNGVQDVDELKAALQRAGGSATTGNRIAQLQTQKAAAS